MTTVNFKGDEMWVHCTCQPWHCHTPKDLSPR